MTKNNGFIEFPKNKAYEFLYFPILLALLFIFNLIENEYIENNFNKLIFIAIGLSSCLASNVLAYVFNLSNVALFIPFRLKPNFLKILGVLFIINAFFI